MAQSTKSSDAAGAAPEAEGVFYLPSPSARASELRKLDDLGPASEVRALRLQLMRVLGWGRNVLCMRAMYSPPTMWDSLEAAAIAGKTIAQAGIDETVVVTLATPAEAAALGLLPDVSPCSPPPPPDSQPASRLQTTPRPLAAALAQSFTHDEQSLAPIIARSTAPSV